MNNFIEQINNEWSSYDNMKIGNTIFDENFVLNSVNNYFSRFPEIIKERVKDSLNNEETSRNLVRAAAANQVFNTMTEQFMSNVGNMTGLQHDVRMTACLVALTSNKSLKKIGVDEEKILDDLVVFAINSNSNGFSFLNDIANCIKVIEKSESSLLSNLVAKNIKDINPYIYEQIVNKKIKNYIKSEDNIEKDLIKQISEEEYPLNINTNSIEKIKQFLLNISSMISLSNNDDLLKKKLQEKEDNKPGINISQSLKNMPNML